MINDILSIILPSRKCSYINQVLLQLLYIDLNCLFHDFGNLYYKHFGQVKLHMIRMLFTL